MKDRIDSAVPNSLPGQPAGYGLAQPGEGTTVPRILVIDDDKLFLASICRHFRRSGYSVMQARSGREALLLLDRLLIDMVVTDILMPEGDGFYLIREIRQRWPALQVIAMSGGDMQAAGEYLDRSLKLGADQAFEKPFPVEGLLAAVRFHLRQPHATTRNCHN